MLYKKGEVTRIDVIRKEDVKPEEDEKKDESK